MSRVTAPLKTRREGRPGGPPGAVGTAVTRCPPHRPVLALLTHTVPTLEMSTPGPLWHARTPGPLELPMCSGTVSSIGPMAGNLLGRPPSLHALRRRSPALVRALRRYYAVARLPAAVHGGLMAHRFLLPARQPSGRGRQRGLPVLAHEVSLHAMGSSTPRGCATLAVSCSAWLPSVRSDAVGSPNRLFRSSIPSLQIPLSNASSAALRLPSHGSGPGWFATPSLYDSCIRYSMPVYPGAIRTSRSPSPAFARHPRHRCYRSRHKE